MLFRSQDNPIGWTDWRGLKKNASLFTFVKKAIALRKKHPVLHMNESVKESDHLGKGFPDLSFHGERAWFCNTENTSRMIGMMLCGEYEQKPDEKEDDFLYIGFNFHWEIRGMALPTLPGEMEWKKVMDTGDLTCDGFYGEEGLVYERTVEVGPRTVVVLQGVKRPMPKKHNKGKTIPGQENTGGESLEKKNVAGLEKNESGEKRASEAAEAELIEAELEKTEPVETELVEIESAKTEYKEKEAD